MAGPASFVGIAGYWVSGTQLNCPRPLHEWSLIEPGPLFPGCFGLPVWIEQAPRCGMTRAHPKLLVSELGSNASASGAAAHAFRSCGL